MTLTIGTPLIPFELPGVDGRSHTTAEHQDKTALAVIFSCNHCPYVRAWEDRLVQIQADYADKGVQFLVISANDAVKYPQDGPEAMQAHAAENGYNFPYLYDESQEIARAYGAARTPEIFLFDQARTLQYHGAPDDNYDDPTAVKSHYLRDALDALLAGQLPTVAATPPVGCTIKWRG
jgi:peroxiredoxin